MHAQPRPLRRRSVLGVFAASVMVIMAACGTDTGTDQRLDRVGAPARPATHESKDLRAAFIASVQRDASSAYAAVAADAMTRLENPAQRFVATFAGGGLTIAPKEDAWHLSMRTVAVGCENAMVPIAPAAPEARGNLVDVFHEGLDEWYLNGPLGIEQGFVLQTAPDCAGPKVITMTVDGDVAARLDDDDGDGRGNAVRFFDGNGQVKATYADLFVTDAHGKAVPAWLSVEAGDISIVVDDSAATYPLAIDPLVAMELTKLTASDGLTNDYGGRVVALSGDTAIMGAATVDGIGVDSGAAYVFVRSGGVWTQQAKLVPSDTAAGDVFGASVAVSGDTVLVGSFYSDGAIVDQGAAYVFVRNGTTWTQQAKLVDSNGSATSLFGWSAALDGDTAVVGIKLDDDKALNAGAAAVFVRSGTTWTQQAKLVASDGASDDSMGGSVAVVGDTVIVGSPNDDAPSTDQGSAYVFVRSGTTWTQQAKLLASDAAINDYLGSSVSLSGDTALLGAFGDDFGTFNHGSAYVFVRSGTTWTQQAKLVASDHVVNDEFGISVSVSGDRALVGAWKDDDKGTDSGSVYLFERSGTTWAEVTKMLASDGVAGDRFGTSVALSGTTAVIGAQFADIGGNVDQGAAYAFAIGKANSDACSSALECASGFCADGVCCNSACGGSNTSDCQACSVATGAAADGTCAPIGAGTQCRASSGSCDVAESCDGTATGCPADAKMAAGTECRASAGACDVAEACDGTSAACPADAKATAGTECRASAGGCDAAEACDGTSAACPVDTKLAAGTECRASAGGCDVAEACDGTANDCPADAKATAGTECRASAGGCDAAEACDGTSAACPVDTKLAAGTECRASAGGCDAAEACDGTSAACPVDTKLAAGTECRASAGGCDVAESCDGSANDCPADAKTAAGTECRAAAGACDAAETCDGASAACPADTKIAQGTLCRASIGACDAPESCDGANNDCPIDELSPAGTLCRVPVGPCDAPDTCDGASIACPDDAKSPAGTLCRSAASACDAPESCDGTNDTCPDDTNAADGTPCKGGLCFDGECKKDGGSSSSSSSSSSSGSDGSGGNTNRPPTKGGAGCSCSTEDNSPKTPWHAPFTAIAFGLLALRRRVSSRR